MTPRQAMDQALKQAISRDLRPDGWTGSFPSLRKRSADGIRLIWFQFSYSGGLFYVNINTCGPDGAMSLNEHVPPNKVTAHKINGGRSIRVGPLSDHGARQFEFGARMYDPGADIVYEPQHYARIADEVMDHLREVAEPWWQAQINERAWESH